MRGIVFTEFLDFTENQYGYPTVDAMLESAAPASGGVYTAIGAYDYAEIAALISALSRLTSVPAPDLLQRFGCYLFGRFAELYPAFFKNCNDPLAFLEAVETKIHAEVLKLYPDAEFPRIPTKRISGGALIINYRSGRPLGYLCLGLIEGCGKYFETDLHIEWAPRNDGLDITVRRRHAFPARAEARP